MPVRPSSMKRGTYLQSGNGTDCIGELPDEILSSIVSYFTVRDAATTSLLSRRWKHLCASMSDLEFDMWSMFGKIDSASSVGECQEYKDIFVRGVNQFLQCYNKGALLVLFRIAFCLESDSSYDIDQWVSFASSMGVEDLTLNFSCVNCYLNGEASRRHDRNSYVLRSELFSQVNMPKLQSVFLRSCNLGPGVINQFCCLKSLLFGDVVLSQHDIELIHSCCLNLESLMLENCKLPLKICISGSLHRLKHFSFYCCLEVEEIELSATNLISFDYAGKNAKLTFSQVPNLEKVYFKVFDINGMQYLFSRLAKDLPLIKSLSIFAALNWVECLPEHTTIFRNVKQLGFCCDIQLKFDIFKIITILKACPLLEKLDLMMRPVSAQVEITGLVMPPESVHKHLREVHMRGFLSGPSFFELITYMLEYATALERIIIDPKARYYHGNVFWSCGFRNTWGEGEREEVCLRFQDHPKSSLMIIL